MITIATRLRPFSFVPGTMCLIPGSFYAIEAFPTLLRIYDLSGKEKKCIKEIPLEVNCPLSHFMLIQDLERGVVTLKLGNQTLHILPNLELVRKKNPPALASQPRLSLGSHKKQEWEKIRARKCFKEIFPLWIKLNDFLPDLPPLEAEGGIFSLLKECEKTLVCNRPEHILPAFKKLYLAGFHHMMVPRLKDDEHQGILPLGEIPHATPLHLIKEGADLICSLFIKVLGDEIIILPHLPPEFYCGRFLHIATPKGEIHLEWSKKTIRQVVFNAKSDGQLFLRFCSSLKSCRLRGEGITSKLSDLGVPIEIKSGSLYVWDRFQK